MKKLTLLAMAVTASVSAFAADQFVYFGTYTEPEKSDGIYIATFDSETGKVGKPALAAKMERPSFLVIHPSKKYLFAVSEVKEGSVSSFKIDSETGLLTLINTLPTQGAHPCHVSTEPYGRCLFIANYTGGSIASYAIADDGSISEASFFQHTGSSVNERRQEAPHAHSANAGPNSKFVFVADLGTDEIVIYKLDSTTAKMTKHGVAKLKPGSGPRHFAFHPDGTKAYAINEMGMTVTAFNFDHEAGTLTEFQTIETIPEKNKSQKGLSTAEVQVHSSGRFLYGSNRGHDTIAAFNIDFSNGKLTKIGNVSIEGKTPRGFGIDETGSYFFAAGQGSDSVAVFKINEDTGNLKFTGEKIGVGIPVCVKFLQR